MVIECIVYIVSYGIGVEDAGFEASMLTAHRFIAY